MTVRKRSETIKEGQPEKVGGRVAQSAPPQARAGGGAAQAAGRAQTRAAAPRRPPRPSPRSPVHSESLWPTQRQVTAQLPAPQSGWQPVGRGRPGPALGHAAAQCTCTQCTVGEAIVPVVCTGCDMLLHVLVVGAGGRVWSAGGWLWSCRHPDAETSWPLRHRANILPCSCMSL